jgi:hypothetical protein
LIDCVVKLNVNSIESTLTLKCLGELIGIIHKMITDRESIIANLPRGDIMNRLLQYIEMVCELSI